VNPDPTLRDLIAIRTRRLADLTAFRRPLNQLDPIERQGAEDAASEYREADARIVAELKRRNRPVVLDGLTYHLTRDRRSFLVLRADGTSPHSDRKPTRWWMYNYDAA
jgi:hypothetical protein